MPRVIGIAGGDNKVEAILGALRGGFINILITDEETALKIIERGEKMSEITCIGILVADLVGRPIDRFPEKGKLMLVRRWNSMLGDVLTTPE